MLDFEVVSFNNGSATSAKIRFAIVEFKAPQYLFERFARHDATLPKIVGFGELASSRVEPCRHLLLIACES